MKYLLRIIEFAFDFAKGFHIWPFIQWLIAAFTSFYNGKPFPSDVSLDLYLIVSFMVLVETFYSFINKGNDTIRNSGHGNSGDIVDSNELIP